MTRLLAGHRALSEATARVAALCVAVMALAYCAEVLAMTYQAMGLLPGRHRPSWYDAGRFWSGDDLGLSAGFSLGGEIAVIAPASESGAPQPPAAHS